MPSFIVTTWETVEGTYLVEAPDEATARARFDGQEPLIDWTGVDQTNYSAFALEVRKVVPEATAKTNLQEGPDA